jgi:hypothetical protein
MMEVHGVNSNNEKLKRHIMRNILTATILLFLFSCKKEISDKELSQALDQSITATGDASQILADYHIGDPNRHPNLYIPTHQLGWYGYTYFGLYDGSKRLIRNTDGSVDFGYSCDIANGVNGPNATAMTIDYSGASDFVVDKSNDGIPDQVYTGDYNFPGMLSIILFKDGKVVGTKMKQSFDVVNGGEIDTYNWRNGQHYYVGDTMYIFHGCRDNYFNKIRVPIVNGVPVSGKYVARVQINPDKLITESDYTDNTSFLPVYIDGPAFTVTVDTTALLGQAPQVSQWIECKVIHGKGLKGVSLKWTDVQCQNYCIEKNGQMIKVWYDGTAFIDPFGTAKDTYRIRSNNWGFAGGNVYNDYKKASTK